MGNKLRFGILIGRGKVAYTHSYEEHSQVSCSPHKILLVIDFLVDNQPTVPLLAHVHIQELRTIFWFFEILVVLNPSAQFIIRHIA